MLRIIAQTSSSAAKSYYSTADYFTEGQELAGGWRGKGAEMLGLSGTVKQAEWDALCDNHHPATGKTLTARKNDYRRVGWDFNFSVPKSVSLLYALTKDARILDAFNESVDQTMSEIERDAQSRVRVKGKNEDRITGNIAYGRFTHFTSRPVDGVPDPQLHAHCFTFNATLDPEENRWKALQIGTLKRDANYFSALMHSRLAARLTELGIPIERTLKGWRVAGLDERTEAKFSRRTRQIEAEAERRGIVDAEEKSQLGARTRDRKNKKLSWDELRTMWLSWLTPDESHAVQAVQRGMHAPARIAFDASAAKEAIHFAADHHFVRSAVISERELLATALNHALGEATPEMVLSTGHRDDLIVGSNNGRVCVTSPAVLEEERRMVAFAKEGRNACEALVTDAALTVPEWFNEGQKKAFDHLLTSRDRATLLRGVSGAGKTSLLSELRKEAMAHGKEVCAFAQSADASRGVLREAGYENAETLATLLVNPRAQEAARGQIILVDEASQIGSRTMAKLFELAGRLDARIILAGDRGQHGSIERGSALRLLEQEAGLKSAQLTQIVRQKDQYRQAVAYLSQGCVDAGFEMLDRTLKWVHEIRDPNERYDRIAAEYLQATEAKRTVLVVAPSHSEREKVTRHIRSALQNEGKIGDDAVSVLKLTDRHLTEPQKGDATSYSEGDTVIFTQNAPGFKKGTRLRVGVNQIPLDLSERFNVYTSSALPLAKGDSIRITTNSGTADGHRVDNGQSFTVMAIADDGTLTLNNGWHLGPSFGHLDYNYCNTSYASQGKTKDRVIIAESTESFPAASREQFYVSVGRGRATCSVYTDDKEGLRDAVSETSDRLTATELAAQLLVRSRLFDQERIDRDRMMTYGREDARFAERSM